MCPQLLTSNRLSGILRRHSIEINLNSIFSSSRAEHIFRKREKILPLKGKRNFLITAALPYVNDVPHLGNLIGSVLSADVFARYCDIRHHRRLFIGGTDEYGTATEMKALSEGVTPKELCDKYYRLHKKIYDWFNIDFDHFGRTTNMHQTKMTQDIFLKIYKSGYTSVSIQKQLYCESCHMFLADRYVRGICPHCESADARGDQCDECGKLLDGVELVEPKCLTCENKPIQRESEHIFLDLPKITPKLQAYLNETLGSASSYWSHNAATISQSQLRRGLRRRGITRDLKWGTPVPLDRFSSKVFYVWFDAPIGYMSITKEFVGDQWTQWWMNPENVELIQFMGKDNIQFHTILFPATLLATEDNYTLPKHISATEYMMYEGKKFSKSRGVGIFGNAVENLGIPSDLLRFYLVYMRPENGDSSFNWDDFSDKINSELLGKIGNFINRVLKFLANNFCGIQPEVEIGPEEEAFLLEIDNQLKEYISSMDKSSMRRAILSILAISQYGNQYIQSEKPWALIKNGTESRKKAETVIGLSANVIVLLSVLLYPIMPNSSAQIRSQCNVSGEINLPEKFSLLLKAGHQHGKAFPLFRRIESAQVTEWISKFDVSK